MIGREREKETLCATVEGLASGHGGAVVVTGSPGIGKSTLLAAVAEHAGDALAGRPEAAVATVVAAESERAWPNAGLHLLLSSMVGAMSHEHQQRVQPLVAEVIAGLDEDATPYDSAMRVQLLLRQADLPLLLVVDDAHRLDARSQEVLGFVARRLRPLTVTLIMAGDSSALRSPVLDGLSTLELRELPREDAVTLLQAAHRDLVGGVAAEINGRVGGNPKALLEVAGQLTGEQRRGQISLDRYLPSTPALQDLLLPDLHELSADQRFALLVASVSEDRRLAPVLTALASLDVDTVEWLLGRHLDVTDGSFRLRTSAVGSIIWRAASLAERTRAHELLSRAYQDRDPEQMLWHSARAQVDDDDALATDLQLASGKLLERGEFKRSVAFAQESVRLTARSDQRVRRLLFSGELAVFAGRADEAVRIARERGRLDISAEQAADLALLEARAWLVGDGHVPTDLIDGHAKLFEETDPDRAAQFWLVGAAGFADRIELAEAAGYLARVQRFLPKLSAGTMGSYRRVAAWWAALAGDIDTASSLIDADSRATDVFAHADRCLRHAQVLILLERYDEARRLLRVITDHRRFGDSPAVVGDAYAVIAVMEVRAGRLIAAREAAESWQQMRGVSTIRRSTTAAYMIRAHALMDDLDAAVEYRAEAESFARRHDDWWIKAVVQAETGAMFLHANQLDEAMSTLERARDYALAYDDPSLLGAEPEFIEVCVRRGDRERASSALAAYAVRVARVPTWWARHTLARCRALVAEHDESLKLFAEAVQTGAESVSQVEMARTQLCYGERLRRLGRRTEATEWIHRSIVLANEAGAVGLARRAEEELGAGGRAGAEQAKRTEPVLLTEAERRIVRLVSAGRRNREIAAELYVSVRTVETHLGRIYRKLGVRSRSELSAYVAAGERSAREAREG